jgi:hypothetical protein
LMLTLTGPWAEAGTAPAKLKDAATKGTATKAIMRVCIAFSR